jgi:molybdenum cofactor cytidylyltransferase
MSLCGIILAAGASSRMGSPKALLTYRGETFLARIRRILATRCREVIVVGAPESSFAVDIVNPHPEHGMISSLQCALSVVPASSNAVLFTPVDLPAIQPETVASLVDDWGGEPLRIPRFGGKRGHPVLAARTLFSEFMAERGTPRDVIQRHEHEIVYLDVDDAGVITDADTPAEYRKLIANG